jgi:hypothetical protein
MILPDFIETVRQTYAEGELSINALTEALGGETKHMRVISQIIRGERFAEVAGPLILPDFGAIAPMVEFMRADRERGMSIPNMATTYQLPGLVVRRILAGDHYRYTPGVIDRSLRDAPNPEPVLTRMNELAAQIGDDWLQVLYPQRYVDRPEPAWLRKEE